MADGEKSTKVAKTKEQGITVFDSAIFEEDANLGLENVGQEDLALPFLKVLSRQDPILDTIDAKAGDIYNTVTGEYYKGATGVKVVPCAYQRRFLEWMPRGSGSGAPVNIYTPADERPKVERSSDDNRDYVVGGEGSYLEETHQHFVLMIDPESGVATHALIAMKSTQLKKSRKFNSMVASRVMQGKNGQFTPPRFSHTYLFKTNSEENSKGSWHGWEITLDEVVGDGGLYAQAKAFSESILKGDVEVKHTSEQGTDASGAHVPF